VLPVLPAEEPPLELELDLKWASHSVRETCPSPLVSTDEKLGADMPDVLLPLAPDELVSEEPELELEELGVLDEPDELGELDDPLVALGLEDELPLAPELLDLSPAAQAWAAKPTNAAVTAALMSFNVIYVSLRG